MIFTPSREASGDVLAQRVLVAFTYPHGHPGTPGIDEGEGCPRCNAEKALNELLRRASHSYSFALAVAEVARLMEREAKLAEQA